MVKLRLVIPVHSTASSCQHCAVAGSTLDIYGHHPDNVPPHAGNVRRHDRLRDNLAEAMRSVAPSHGISYLSRETFR